MNQAFDLDALNFVLAGAREGFGPFLGVYLQHQGFEPAKIGLAMGLAGLVGLLATVPLGALIDRIASKRAAVVVAVALIAVGAFIVVSNRQISLVAVGQVLIGVADSSLAPVVAALTLGLVGRERYRTRVARNEAFNHAGNALNAALAALLGYAFGLGYVSVAIAVMALATSVVIRRIDPQQIDHEAARGGTPNEDSAWKVLRTNRPILTLAASVLAFQTANGAMLPFIAQDLTSQGRDPSLITGAMTVGAQVSMIAASLLVPKLARAVGNEKVLSLAFIFVIVRGLLAAASGAWWSIAVVQLPEGLSVGLAGVAIPALVVNIMNGSGRAGAGLGGVMTAYGAGAALSPLLAGAIAQTLGFQAAFVAISCVAIIGLVSWMLSQSAVAPKQKRQQGAAQTRAPA
jgi:predicted MFS family arabinose efflux permease